MFNSIFRKQFFSYISALIITFVLLGIGLSKVFENYFISNTKEVLIEQGKTISELYQMTYAREVLLGVYDESEIYNELKILEKYSKASYLLVDKDFIIKAASFELIKNRNLPIKIDEISLLNEGKIIEIKGNLGGIFKETYLTVACPVIVDGKVIGSIFMNASVPEIQKSISEVFRITVLLLFVSGGIAFILTFISARTISKPLYQMNEAAKIISSGDFEKRLEIKSKDEVGQLGNSFNLMAESLFKQEKQRRDFVSNISHDLRSPLTSISGFLEAILDGTIPPEKQEKYIRIIQEETNRLSKLANDILDINKISLEQLEKSKFDINEVIRKTVIMLEKRITDKNIDLEISFSDDVNFVIADYEKIQRVIYNILDNSIKFTQNNGIIKIETTTIESKIKIKIKDNGVGISSEDQKHVFDRFFKVDSSRGIDKKGTGLGLSIIKEFIKAHDENISLESKEGEGTEISFSLEMAD